MMAIEEETVHRFSTRLRNRAPPYPLRYAGYSYPLKTRSSGGSSRPARKISISKKNRLDKIEDQLFGSADYKEQSLEFANAALSRFLSRGVNFELVKPGLFEGARISGGSLFHFNFKAKQISVPDAPVQTFFGQIRLMGDCPTDLRMYFDCCTTMGPTNKLPKEVYDGGCIYCTPLVYHPKGGSKKLIRGCVNDDVSWLCRDTDSGHFQPSWYKYSEQIEHLNHLSGVGYRPARRISNSRKSRVDEMEDSIFRRNEEYKEQCLENAEDALCYLNSTGEVKFELVKPGLRGVAGISRGIIYHINFKAKHKDDPDAPVHTFFSQLRYMGNNRFDMSTYVDFCVDLGPSTELPDKAYSGGCQYCALVDVYHPRGGCKKLLSGCRSNDSKWLYGEKHERIESFIVPRTYAE